MSIAISSIKEQDLNLLNKKLFNKNLVATDEQKQTNNNPFANIGNISINNIEENKQNLQEIANFISKTENISTNKADLNISKDDDPNKSLIETVLSKIGQLFFSKSMEQKSSLLAKLTRPNAAMIIASICGFDTEEVGDAFKKGAVTGDSDNLLDAYKRYYNKAYANAQKSGWHAIFEGLNAIPNFGSITINTGAQYVGKRVGSVMGDKFTALIGSVLSGVGRGFNAFGEAVGTRLKYFYGMYKGIMTWDKDGICNTVKETLEDYKNIGISIKDKAVEIAGDIKNLFTEKTKVGNALNSIKNKISGFFNFG